MTHEAIPVKSIDLIDLDRHAVIEASAGTGKTFCIENLVVRILSEKRVPLEKILLLTFTEKATGELHARIRESIERKFKENHDPILEEALENFDKASIFTIHGFCQRMLQQYAFENGEGFELELVDDVPIYQSCLKKQQRHLWPSKHLTRLKSVMAVSNFPDMHSGKSRWEEIVLEIAQAYRPSAGDILKPALMNDYDDSSIQEILETYFKQISELCGKINTSNMFASALVTWYDKIPDMNYFHKKSRIENILIALLIAVDHYRNENLSISQFLNFLYSAYEDNDFQSQGIDVLLDALGPTDDAQIEKLQTICQLINELVVKIKAYDISMQLSVSAVKQLQEDVRQYKEERNLISFDDMLLHLYRALSQNNHRSELLQEKLQSRFQFALVDEFQDTDMIQWEIFKTIFLTSDEHKLFIIGDPKQAIYSFRNADLETYREAKSYMLESKDALLYSLKINWRSIPPLINSMNRLCGETDWFEKDLFVPVEAPEETARRSRLFHDETGRAAMSLVHLEGKLTSKKAQRWFAHFTAREIADLLKTPKLIIEDDGKARALQANDICILIRKASDAEMIEKFLSKQEIPYAFYKKSGVYQSSEAKQLYFLFSAIQQPGNLKAVRKVMLSDFFSVTIENIESYDELKADFPLVKLLRKWHNFAAARDWSSLFDSIIYDSGILYRYDDFHLHEQQINNYRQILQDLSIEAYQHNLHISDLIKLIKNYYQESKSNSQDADIFKQETNSSKVQIMTIHTSKGLEFPVVFLAGGFTQAIRDNYWRYHDEKKNLIFDLAKNPEFQIAYGSEKNNEERRLYYVALTRAIYKLYIPYFKPIKASAYVSSISTFIFPAIEEISEYYDANEMRIIDKNGRDISTEKYRPQLDKFQKEDTPEDSKLTVDLERFVLSETEMNFANRTRRIGSFSFFAHGKSEMSSVVDKLDTYSDDNMKFDEYEIDDKKEADETALPKGTVTGSLLHDILENVDFQIVGQIKTLEDASDHSHIRWVINESLERFPLIADSPAILTKWKIELCQLVWKSLTVELMPGFRLADLSTEEKIHELEFIFPAIHGEDVPDTHIKEGFLMGFIDLIFKVKDTYYILDWKSNTLDSYDSEGIEICMRDSNYILQHKIYTIAVLKWLSSIQTNFSLKNFGGVFYIFMRGIDPANPLSGIYFDEVEDEADIVTISRELADLYKLELVH
ncbi:MAG: UvrD-helicase domain-containing protein [Lentisphaeria bacterium]|nr:UvrD-helicase domain-containing protein [Lentisphaeria bacterium]NQZ70433.1 UvrD-helicase domain-containing protein [Lentisphaeria bacterium]